MKKPKTEKRNQIRFILWIIFLMDILIFFLAIIFGRSVGYATYIKAHFWLALILSSTLLITMIVLLFLESLWRYMEKKEV
ncbi:MAG TPA: hypothetical protein VHP36_07630 [Chitinispirillaceae bacterium]|nr:hypothetical protein [Chitinispirillaceae bacterium]